MRVFVRSKVDAWPRTLGVEIVRARDDATRQSARTRTRSRIPNWGYSEATKLASPFLAAGWISCIKWGVPLILCVGRQMPLRHKLRA